MNNSPVDPFAELKSRAASPGGRVLEALRQEIAHDAAPKPAIARSTRFFWSVLCLVLGLALTSLRAVQQSPGALVLAMTALGASVLGLLALGVIPGSFGRLSLSWRRALLAFLLLGGFAVLVGQADTWISLREFAATPAHLSSLRCARHSLLSGAVGAAGLLWLWRRTDPYSPALTGALLGLFGGVAGALSVGLLCAEREGLHLTTGHGAGLLLLMALGGLLGSRWLRP